MEMKIVSLSVLSLGLFSIALPFGASAQVCDPEGYAERPKEERQTIDKGFQAEPKMTEMVLYLNAPTSVVGPKVLAAMLNCKMPVGAAGGGVYEADYGEETGMLSIFLLKARVYAVPAGDSATVVRFTGAEQSKYEGGASTKPVSNKNTGRSGRSWMSMRGVMKQLMTDSTLKADRVKSTKISAPFLFGESGTGTSK